MKGSIVGRSKVVAYHEAGHAAVSSSCGHGIRRVIVAPSPLLRSGELGRVDYWDFQHEADVDAEGLTLATLAAGAAERRLTGSHHVEREAGDRQQALALCSIMRKDAPSSPAVVQHLDTLTTLADSLVHQAWLWDWIVRVANRLMTSRVPLTGRDVQVLGEHVRRRKECA